MEEKGMIEQEREKTRKLKRCKLSSGVVLSNLFCPVCSATIPDDGKIRNYCHFCGQKLEAGWECEGDKNGD